jgi:hypothetical protein
MVHGVGMLGCVPQPAFVSMAAYACLAAQEGEILRRAFCRAWKRAMKMELPEQDSRNNCHANRHPKSEAHPPRPWRRSGLVLGTFSLRRGGGRAHLTSLSS